MDQWIQKLSLAGLLVVVGLCLYGSTNREVTCHTPAHFNNDHSSYAHQTCSKPDALTYHIEDGPLPVASLPENRTLWTSHIDTKSVWLLKLALVELIVVCTAYCLIDWLVAAGCFDARSPHEELHQSYFKVPLYFLIQIVSAICWFIFTTMSNQENVFPTGQSVFMCDYSIRMVGNVQRIGVQCIDDHDSFTRAAYMINSGLALVVTITKFIHIVSVLLVGPFLGLKGARATLMQTRAIKDPGQLGLGFAFSDLYFAMVASGKGNGGPLLLPPSGADRAGGGRSKDTELAHLVSSD